MRYCRTYRIAILHLCIAAMMVLTVSCKPKKQASAAPKAASERSPEEVFGNLYIEACKEKTLNNTARAIELFEKCKNLKPQEASVYFNLSELYYSNRESFLMSLEYAEKAFKLAPSNAFYALHYSSLLERQGNYAEAITVLQQSIKLNPKDKELYVKCISEYNNKRDFKGALLMWEQYEAAFGFKKIASEEKYKLYKLTGDKVKAQAEIRKLQSKYPGDYQYFLDAGNDYLADNDKVHALENFNKAEALSPHDWKVCKTLSSYWEEAGDKAKSDAYFVKAFADPATDIKYKHRDILNLLTANAHDTAVDAAVARNIAAAHPNSGDALSLSGSLYMLAGNYNEAVNSHLKAVNIDPNLFNSWKELLMSLDKLGRYKELNEQSARAVEYYPSNSLVYEYSAIAYNKLKAYEKALEAVSTGKSFSVEDSLTDKLMVQQGLAQYGLGKYTEAYSIFQQLLLKKPAEGDLHDYLGNVQFKRNNIEDAVKFWLTAKKYGCKDPLLDKKINDSQLYE